VALKLSELRAMHIRQNGGKQELIVDGRQAPAAPAINGATRASPLTPINAS